MAGKEQLSRRDFLKIGVATAAALLFKPRFVPETVQANSEYPYIPQPTWTTCGYAVMAMLAAQEKNEDVARVFERVKGYFEMIGKYDVRLGESALKDYLEREESIPINSAEKIWDQNLLQDQVRNYKSTIVCVTSNYGEEDPRKNPANHWIIVDDVSEVDGKTYALVRDPLRSTEEYKTKKTLTSDMLPAENGSIYIPVDKFISAMGKNYLHTDDGVSESPFQKKSSSSKIN
jgi:hypothetical protein